MGADVLRQDGDGEALVAAGEERDLVVDAAGARAPSALEVNGPAAEPQLADAPALGRDDVAQQAERVGAMALREEGLRRRKKRVWSRAVIRELPQIGLTGVNRPMRAARARRADRWVRRG